MYRLQIVYLITCLNMHLSKVRFAFAAAMARILNTVKPASPGSLSLCLFRLVRILLSVADTLFTFRLAAEESNQLI